MQNQERLTLAHTTNSRLLNNIRVIPEQLVIIQNGNKPQNFCNKMTLSSQYKPKQHMEVKQLEKQINTTHKPGNPLV